jgi:hypothetical protein
MLSQLLSQGGQQQRLCLPTEQGKVAEYLGQEEGAAGRGHVSHSDQTATAASKLHTLSLRSLLLLVLMLLLIISGHITTVGECWHQHQNTHTYLRE